METVRKGLSFSPKQEQRRKPASIPHAGSSEFSVKSHLGISLYYFWAFYSFSDVCERLGGSAAICRGPSWVSDRRPVPESQPWKRALYPMMAFMMVRSTISRFRCYGIALRGLGRMPRLRTSTEDVYDELCCQGRSHSALSFRRQRPFSRALSAGLLFDFFSRFASDSTCEREAQCSEPKTPLGVPQPTPSPSSLPRHVHVLPSPGSRKEKEKVESEAKR